MCNKRSSKSMDVIRPISENRAEFYKKIKVDSCMDRLIYVLNMRGIKTLACCCGHGRYNMYNKRFI